MGGPLALRTLPPPLVGSEPLVLVIPRVTPGGGTTVVGSFGAALGGGVTLFLLDSLGFVCLVVFKMRKEVTLEQGSWGS